LRPQAAWPLAEDPTLLPAGLPIPVDDGAAAHLPGLRLPDGLLLASTGGQPVDLAERSARRRTVVFAYPRTGRPGEAPLVPEWDLIPGARGCTPEACAFRDLAEVFEGAELVWLVGYLGDGAGSADAPDRQTLIFMDLSPKRSPRRICGLPGHHDVRYQLARGIVEFLESGARNS